VQAHSATGTKSGDCHIKCKHLTVGIKEWQLVIINHNHHQTDNIQCVITITMTQTTSAVQTISKPMTLCLILSNLPPVGTHD